MKYTTLHEILEHGPCGQETEGLTGFSKLLLALNKTQSDDEPLSFAEILKHNGIKDAVWCLCVLEYEDRRHFQADVAESVLHIFEAEYPDDDRPRKAIEAARTGTIEESARATYANYAATYVTYANYANYAATYAARAAHAADAAYATAASAARSAHAHATAANYATAHTEKWQEIEIIFRRYFA